MKAAHLVHTFSRLSETFIYDYIKAEQELGIGCEILTFNRENENDRPFFKEKIHPLKIPAWDLRRYLNRGKASLLKINIETANWNLYRNQLAQKLDVITPDVVHAHFGPMGVLAMPIAQKLQIPLVVSFHGRDAFELPNEPYWKQKYEQLFLSAGAITVVSNYMKKHLVGMNGPQEKIHIIHVGKKLNAYTFKRPQKPIKNWISVGRLSEKKGFLDCMEAFAIALKKDKEINLSIIGDGPDRDSIKAAIEKLQLHEAVTLLGSMPHRKVIDYLSKADAFILCSKTAIGGDKEGIPTVLMEAQAMGLPCVSTRHSGIPEVIPAQNQAFLAPEGDIDTIANCIDKVSHCTQNELITMADLGRAKIKSAFNINMESKKLIDLYQNLASRSIT